jgi:hypothetical protein
MGNHYIQYGDHYIQSGEPLYSIWGTIIFNLGNHYIQSIGILSESCLNHVGILSESCPRADNV